MGVPKYSDVRSSDPLPPEALTGGGGGDAVADMDERSVFRSNSSAVPPMRQVSEGEPDVEYSPASVPAEMREPPSPIDMEEGIPEGMKGGKD